MTFLRKKLILSVFLSLIFPLNVNAEKINLAKEVNLFGLSKKYPICKNKLYRDDCYGIKRGKDFSIEGYWKKNRLWEGIRRDEIANVISFKYIDGIKYPLSKCVLNIFGWYSCKYGDKFKPIDNGRFDQFGSKQGQFLYKWKSGDIYEGNFKDDDLHGYGKLYWSGGNIYQGNWKKDVRHGYGKMTWSNGDVYEGNYKDDVPHGYGKITWSNGDVYEGNWYEGEMVDK